MSRFHQLFRVSGVANDQTLDTGLTSTKAEKKKLIAIHLQMDKYAATDDNQVMGFHEQSEQFSLPEKMFPTELAAAVAQTANGGKMKKIDVDLELPEGEKFKVGIKCAATAINIRGSYEYEIIS